MAQPSDLTRDVLLRKANPYTSLERWNRYSQVSWAIKSRDLDALKAIFDYPYDVGVPTIDKAFNHPLLILVNTFTGRYDRSEIENSTDLKIMELVLSKTWSIFRTQRIEFPNARPNIFHAAAASNCAAFFCTTRRLNLCGIDMSECEDFKATDSHRQRRGYNILHVAAQKCNLPVVQEIMDISGDLIHGVTADKSTPLHLAINQTVTSRNYATVEHILRAAPEIIRKKDENNFSAFSLVVQEERRRQKAAETEVSQYNMDELKLLLKETILRQQISSKEKRDLLFDGDGQSQNHREIQLSLDLSIFDHNPRLLTQLTLRHNDNRFDLFLATLKAQRLNFDKPGCLELVKTPDLQCSSRRLCNRGTADTSFSQQAKQLFAYLREDRQGVRRIIEIDVRDCLDHPHSNVEIIDCLEGMGVKKFDWRKQDIPIDVLRRAAPNVEEIWLYSSGNRDILDRWASHEGLSSLRNLQKVHIELWPRDPIENSPAARVWEHLKEEYEHIFSKLIEHNYSCRQLLRFDETLNRYVNMCACRGRPRFKFFEITEAVDTSDKHGHFDEDPLGINHDITHDIFHELESIRGSLLKLSSFARRGHPASKFCMKNVTKVAILDSGVASHMFDNIRGVSFIEDNLVPVGSGHWNIVVSAHGTQLAKLIRRLDPTCELYAAKVHIGGRDNSGVDLKAAAEALDWACKTIKADVVCLAWSFSKQQTTAAVNLLDKINKYKPKTLIFSAVGSRNEKESLPAQNCNFQIASCRMDGSVSKYSEISHANYHLPGEGLTVPIPTYLDPSGMSEKMQGSSSGTALAAGLASMLLTLAKFAYYGAYNRKLQVLGDSTPSAGLEIEVAKHYGLPEMMLTRLKARFVSLLFTEMCERETQSPNFVKPWKMFPNAKDFHRKDAPRLQRMIRECFNEFSPQLMVGLDEDVV